MPKEQEVQIKTSVKNMTMFMRAFLASLAAAGIGAAGGMIGSSTDASDKEARIAELESACSGYSVRLTATETKLQNYEYNLIEMRKDLAEIRSTNTQILFLLQRGK